MNKEDGGLWGDITTFFAGSKENTLLGYSETILNAMNAILMHEITGNGVDRMRRAKDELDAYISKRGTNAGTQKDD